MPTSVDLLELKPRVRLGRKIVWLLLATLLVWSFGLRLWFATPELSSKRFWDERYGLENLRPLLEHGQLRPVHGFHPSFSYLPHGIVLKASDLVYRATDLEIFAVFDSQGGYTPTAYLICRGVQVVFGTLCLVFLFLVGRLLGGDGLGLLAAFLLSAVPWFLRQSVLFKADIVLLFTLVLTLYLSLRAVERPSLRSFAAAGVGIGLALSSKFSAGPVAIPLAVGTLVRPGSKRRPLLLLGVAAIVSVGVVLLLQPYIVIDPSIYTESMSKTLRVYERNARGTGGSRLYVVTHIAESLSSASFHGPVVGALALVGLASVALLGLWSLRRSKVAVGWLMIVSFVIGYTTLYAFSTPRASPHNYLPLSPFAALGAAWSLLAGWGLLTGRMPARQRQMLGTSMATVVVLVLGWSASRYVYQNTVPRTRDLALAILKTRLAEPPGRSVYAEQDFQISTHRLRLRGGLAVAQEENLRSRTPAVLNRADAEIFLAQRLKDESVAAFYRGRMERIPAAGIHRIEPRWFRAWGPSLVVLVHPLELARTSEGEWIRNVSDRRVYEAELPPTEAPTELISVAFRVRRAKWVELSVAGRRQELFPFQGPWRGQQFITSRFVADTPAQLRLNRADGPDRIGFVVHHWRQGD